jgi:4-amino-4-deoxy-L-arabinose transferase-like glycosyltransferase
MTDLGTEEPVTDDEPGDETAAPTASPRWYLPGMVAVAGAALAVRLLNVVVWRPTCALNIYDVGIQGGPGPGFDPAGGQAGCFAIWGDTAYSYLQGRLIAGGDWYVDSLRWFTSGGAVVRPSSGDPPLFALYVAVLARLGLTSGTAMRVVTAFVGVAGVVLLALLARRLAGPRAALIAGGIAAVYPLLWINDGMLLSESLYVPLVLVALHAAYSFWERPGARSAVVLGATMALAALVRAEALLLLVVVPLPLLWGLRRAGAATGSALVRLGLVIAGVGALVVAPWLAFNLTRFEHPALMTSATGAVLSSGSCDRTYTGDVIGYYATCFEDHVAAGGLVDGKVPCAAVPAPPPGADCWVDDPEGDETVRDHYRTAYATDYIGGHLGRLPVVMAARVGRIWDLYTPELGSDVEPLGQNVRLNWQLEGRGRVPSQVGLLLFWAMLPLAGAGVVRLRRERIPLSPLIAIAVVITVTAAVTIGVTRYRVPLDVVVVVLAAAGIDALLPGPIQRRSRVRDIPPSPGPIHQRSKLREIAPSSWAVTRKMRARGQEPRAAPPQEREL